MRLTNAKIKSLPIGKKVADGGGLYYQPTALGRSKWTYRYARNGKSRETGLGTYPEVTLAEARLTHAEQRKVFVGGRDTIEAKRRLVERDRARETLRFSYVADLLIKSRAVRWTNDKSEAQWRSSLAAYAYPTLDSKPLADLGKDEVIAVLQPYWTEKTETMSRVRQRMRAVFDYARARGWYEKDNPASWENNLELVFAHKPDGGHHKSLTYRQLPVFFDSLRQWDTTSAYALQPTILTAARTTEVRLAKREEFDLNRGVWVVPEDRMKGREMHRVPLSPFVVGLVDKMMQSHNQQYLFPSTKPDKGLSNGAMHQFLRRNYSEETFTVHGFRTTFRTWAAEVGDYDQMLAELALSHKVGDKVVRSYLRTDMFDKRKQMMEDYTQFALSGGQWDSMVVH